MSSGYSDLVGAMQLGEEGVQVARTTGDDRTLGFALNHFGWAWLVSGDAGKARAILAEGVDRLRRSGDGFETANVLDTLALATLECGDRGLAASLWAESLQMALMLGRMASIAWCLIGFDRLAADSDPGRALRLAAGAAAIKKRAVGDDGGTVGGVACRELVGGGQELARRRVGRSLLANRRSHAS